MVYCTVHTTTIELLIVLNIVCDHSLVLNIARADNYSRLISNQPLQKYRQKSTIQKRLIILTEHRW